MTRNLLSLFYYIKEQIDFFTKEKMIIIKKKDKYETALQKVISESDV
jgi:hypothetical protein